MGNTTHTSGFCATGNRTVTFTYDIANMGITRLSGTFGIVDIGHPNNIGGNLTVICNSSGFELGSVTVNAGDEPMFANVNIPPDTQIVQVRLQVDGAGMVVGFGDAFFR